MGWPENTHRRKKQKNKNKNKSSGSLMTAEKQVKFSIELIDFYCRFERDDLGEDINSVVQELKEKSSECEEGKDFESMQTLLNHC